MSGGVDCVTKSVQKQTAGCHASIPCGDRMVIAKAIRVNEMVERYARMPYLLYEMVDICE